MSKNRLKALEPIRLQQFLQTRREEMIYLKEQINQCNGNKLAFQQLPRYMRRRQMSHNTKRLPKRLREIDVAQKLKSRPEKKTLKALRRYCRRRLKKRYTIRSSKGQARWLETHVWHAKRFRMVTKWNFRLAERSYEKMFRKIYRSIDRGCFAHDASYTNCFELQGPRNVIMRRLDLLTDQRSNRLFSDSYYSSGSFKGSAIIFKPYRYPFQAIGPISFVWLKNEDEDTDRKNKIVRFWFWTHAAFAKSICERFCKSFALDRVTLQNSETNVCLLDLAQKVNVLRLIGHKSLQMLQDMLKIPLNSHPNKWFQENVIQRPKQLEIFLKQKNHWKQVMTLTDPTDLEANRVLNLTVMNPQYVSQMLADHKSVASKKKNVSSELSPLKQSSEIENSVDNQPSTKKRKLNLSRLDKKQKKSLNSEIVNSGGFLHGLLRSKDETVTFAKETVLQTNETTVNVKQCLVGGEMLQLRKNITVEVIPIMLVQRAGNRVRRYRNVGYGAGFDLFLPAAWSRSFWNCFHLRRACAGGLNAINWLAFERGLLSPFTPDTKVGRIELQQIGNQEADNYFRRPPKCRPNFQKLNVPVPFKVNWSVLLRDWKTNSEEEQLLFYVLRNKVVLEQLNHALRQAAASSTSLKYSKIDIPNADQCLVPVRLRTIRKKGKFGRLTMICLPDPVDYATVKQSNGLLEPQKPDKNNYARKKLRHEHRRQLKRFHKLRRREKHMRRLENEQKSTKDDDDDDDDDDVEMIDIDDSEDETPDETIRRRPTISDEYKTKMDKLWLNISNDESDDETYRYKCTRQIMGFVEMGDFSMRSGFGAAVGYITLNSLFKLIADRYRLQTTATENREMFVWARDRHNLYYRSCSIDIIPFDNNDL